MVDKSDNFVNVRRKTPFFVEIKRNTQMNFVNPYFTQNIESLYKDYSVLFRETLVVFCEKETQKSNCLLEEILIFLLMPFCLGRFLRFCYLYGCVLSITWTVTSILLIGRLHRAYYLDGYVEPTTRTVTSNLILGRLHVSYYSDGCIEPTNWTVTSSLLLGRLHRAYYSDGCVGPTNLMATSSLLLRQLQGSY
jgi:hypothetical protein